MTKAADHLWVNGVVAVRDHQPYIQISNENGIVAQLSMAQAQHVARDILVMAARTEMDAMVWKFFSREGFPEGAGIALMGELREFRAQQDAEAVEHKTDRGEYEGQI